MRRVWYFGGSVGEVVIHYWTRRKASKTPKILQSFKRPSFLYTLVKYMPHIAPNVSFTNVSREWRLKWKDEETLRKCQDGSQTSAFIDILHRRVVRWRMSSCRDDFLRNASFFFAFFSDSRVEFRKKRSPHSAMYRSDRCPPATNSLHGRLGIDSPHRVW